MLFNIEQIKEHKYTPVIVIKKGIQFLTSSRIVATFDAT